MKLKNMKLSELKELCSRFKCFQCPIWDVDMDCCFFALSRIPCQWRVEKKKGIPATQIIQMLDPQVPQVEIRDSALFWLGDNEERLRLLLGDLKNGKVDEKTD